MSEDDGTLALSFASDADVVHIDEDGAEDADELTRIEAGGELLDLLAQHETSLAEL